MSENKPQKQKRSIVITTLVSALFSFLFIMLWVSFNWVTLGFSQTAQKLAMMQMKNKEIVRHIPGSVWESVSTNLANQPQLQEMTAQMHTMVRKGSEASIDALVAASDFLPDFTSSTLSSRSELNSAWGLLSQKLYQGFFLLKLSTSLVLTKLLILVAASPLFLLLGAVGLVDGLSQREIRTAELGRESSYLFHQLNKWVFHLVFMVMFVWLALPMSVEPYCILMPLSLLFAFMISLTASRFKKHL